MRRSVVYFLFFFLFPVIAAAQKDCAAIVEYTASTGDPEKAGASDLFEGTVRTLFPRPTLLSEKQVVQWKFAGGEIVDTQEDVFVDKTEDYPEETVRNIKFTAETEGVTQTITLRFNLNDHNIARLRFNGEKGTSSSVERNGSSNPPRYQVSLPEWFVVNGLRCQAAPLLLQSERYVSQPEEEEPIDSDFLLEYAPREMREFPYEDELFPTTTQFTFRLQNTAAEDLNLGNLKVEYWFDGADEEGVNLQIAQGPSEYTSNCSWSNLGCKFIKTEVEAGLKNVHGAQYKVVISFPDSSTKLRGTKSRQQTDNDDSVDRLRAIIIVTSKRPFSPMDAVVDYSFKNTAVQTDQRGRNEEFIQRSLERNRRMIVYNGTTLIWGSPPAGGQDKVNVTEIENGQSDFCYLKTDYLRSGPLISKQCGLKMRYCCSEEYPPEAENPSIGDTDNDAKDSNVDAQPPAANPLSPVVEKNGAKETVPVWIIGAIAGAWIFVAVSCCLVLLRRCFRSGWISSSMTQNAEISLNNQSPFQRHRMSLWSVAWSIDDSGPPNTKEAQCGHVAPSVNCEIKYHTVPSISETEYHSLVQLCSQERNDEEECSLRRSSSWAGCMHWVWEPWDVAAIHCSGPVATSRRRLATFQTSTRKIQNIPLDVDYQTEIEPNLGSILGEGGFGQVFAASWKGQPVAVKLMKVDTEAMYKSLKDEVKLTSRMCHGRIVRLLAACLSNENHICLIMELVENGNLSRRIHNKNLRKLEYLQVLQIGLDVAQGLNYLHPTVIHRDLKPQNVLLDKNNRAKIADFGISRFKDPHRSYLSVTQTGGTPNYMAPELFNGTRVDEKCDIYSLGCILHEAMTRSVPFSDLPSDYCAPLFQIIKTVAIDKRRPKIPEFFPHGLAHIIRKCWKDNPRSRPSASEVCEELKQLIDREIDRIEGERKALRDAAFASSAAEGSSSTSKCRASTSSPPSWPLDDRREENDDRHDSALTQPERSEHECTIESRAASSE